MSTNTAPQIVVGLDGSAASLIALRWALAEGVRTGADVEVVHCWHPQSLRDIAFGSRHELHNASLCMLDNEVRTALKSMTAAPTIRQSSIEGRPSTVLLEHSRGADLLVLGSHGQTTMHDVTFGQVAVNCRRHMKCPMVVVGLDGNITRYEPLRHPARAS